MHKVVWLFVIITQDPLDRFASNFDWGIRENHGNFLVQVFRVYVEWNDF